MRGHCCAAPETRVQSKIMKTGIGIIAVGTVPLLLYVIFGPADGNPIGLGLLAWASWLVGGICIVAALLGRLFARDRR